MIDREKVIKGLERFIADFKPFCGNKSDWQRVCSVCGEQSPSLFKYCPNCGAMMDGQAEEMWE